MNRTRQNCRRLRRQRGGKVAANKVLEKILSIGFELETSRGFICRVALTAVAGRYVLYPIEGTTLEIPAARSDAPPLEIVTDIWDDFAMNSSKSLKGMNFYLNKWLGRGGSTPIEFVSATGTVYELSSPECIRHIEFHRTYLSPPRSENIIIDNLTETMSSIKEFLLSSQSNESVTITPAIENIHPNYHIYHYTIPAAAAAAGEYCIIIPLWTPAAAGENLLNRLQFNPQITIGTQMSDFLEVANYLAEMYPNDTYKHMMTTDRTITNRTSLLLAGDEPLREDYEIGINDNILKIYQFTQDVLRDFPAASAAGTKMFHLLKTWIFMAAADLAAVFDNLIENEDEHEVIIDTDKHEIPFNSRHWPFETFPLTAARGGTLLNQWLAHIEKLVLENRANSLKYYCYLVLLQCTKMALSQRSASAAGLVVGPRFYSFMIPKKYQKDGITRLEFRKDSTMFPAPRTAAADKVILIEFRSFSMNLLNTFDRYQIPSHRNFSVRYNIDTYFEALANAAAARA